MKIKNIFKLSTVYNNPVVCKKCKPQGSNVGYAQRMKKLKQIKDSMKNGVDPLDLLNPRNYHNNEELSKQRLDICRSCPNIMANLVCSQCGCIMHMKVKLTEATCPIGKW